MAKQISATVHATLPVSITMTSDQVMDHLYGVLTDVDTERLGLLLKSKLVMDLTKNYSDINRYYINRDLKVVYRDYHEYEAHTQLTSEQIAAYRRFEMALDELIFHSRDK
jgi:hypothetical protein